MKLTFKSGSKTEPPTSWNSEVRIDGRKLDMINHFWIDSRVGDVVHWGVSYKDDSLYKRLVFRIKQLYYALKRQLKL